MKIKQAKNIIIFAVSKLRMTPELIVEKSFRLEWLGIQNL